MAKSGVTVGSFLWGYEADKLILHVLRENPHHGVARGFSRRLRNRLEKHGMTNTLESNCRITWIHDGRLLRDCVIEAIPGIESKVENFLEYKARTV